MKKKFLRHAASSLFVLAACTEAANGHAGPEDPTDEEKATARPLAIEGIQLAASGDCARAIDKLVGAEAFVHAPTTAVPLAQCEIQSGQIITGTELLIRVVHEGLPPNAPPSFIEATRRAQSILVLAQRRIAHLRIHVDRPPGPPEALQLTVDGQPVISVLLDNDRPTDPGTHHVVAKQEGFTIAEADVTLADGQTQAVSLRIEPLPPPVAPSVPVDRGRAAGAIAGPSATRLECPAPSAEPSPAAEPQSARASPQTPAFVAFSIAGAGLLVGTGFGIAALSAKSTLDAACSEKLCPISSQSDIDAMHADAIFATVGWGLAVAGGAAGVILWLTAHGPEHAKAARIDLRPWVGPASLGLSGRFQ